MRDKLGGKEDMHGEDAGYEGAILDLMASRPMSTLDGAHLMEGPGEDVQIVAGPEVNFATLGSDPTSTEVAIALPLAALAGFGIYKLASSGGGGGSSGPSKPWLYKANPTYWFKSDREKRLYSALKTGGYQDAQNKQDLDLAERAYYATEQARQKEARIQEIEQSLANKPAGSATSGDIDYNVDKTTGAYQIMLETLQNAGLTNKKTWTKKEIDNALQIMNQKHQEIAGRRPGSEDFYKNKAQSWMKANGVTMGYTSSGDDAPPAGYPPPAKGGGNVGPAGYPLPGMSPKTDKKILSALTKAGFPIAAGSTWDKDSAPATSAVDVVSKAMGQGEPAAKAWLLSFFERQNIAFQGSSSGKVYEVHGGRLVVAAPDAPADVAVATSKGAKPTGKVSGWDDTVGVYDVQRAQRQQQAARITAGYSAGLKSVGDAVSSLDLSSKKTWYMQDFNSVVQLVKKQNPSWGRGIPWKFVMQWMSNHKIKGGPRSGGHIGYTPSPWEKGLAYDTAMTTVDPTAQSWMKTNGVTVSGAGAFVGWRIGGHPNDAIINGILKRFNLLDKVWVTQGWRGKIQVPNLSRKKYPTLFRELVLGKKIPGLTNKEADAAIRGWAYRNKIAIFGNLVNPRANIPINGDDVGYDTAMTTVDPTLMPTTGAARRTNVKGNHFVGYGPSPWEKTLGFNTAVSLVNSTEMPTTGVGFNLTINTRWQRSSKNDKVIGDNAKDLIEFTRSRYGISYQNLSRKKYPLLVKRVSGSFPAKKDIDPAIRGWAYRNRVAIYGNMVNPRANVAINGDEVGYNAEKFSTVDSTMAPTTGARRKSNVRGMFVGYASNPWEQGLVDSTVMSTIDPTFMPTTGGWRGSRRSSMHGDGFVGAADAQTQGQVQILANMAKFQDANIKQIATAAGLRGKKTWSSADIDKVAAGLLKKMMGATGQKPDAANANIARNVTRAWTGLVGVSVVGAEGFVGNAFIGNAFVGGDGFVGNAFVGGDGGAFVGSWLGTLGKVLATPVMATFWGVGKAVQGTGWLVQKGGQGLAWTGGKGLGAMWGGGKKGGAPGAPGAAPGTPGFVGMPPGGPGGMTPQQVAMYQQTLARKAAASRRILAAESAQEAAIVRQQQASDLQTAQKQAAEAEEAAQTAEQVAMQAQATQDLPETPAALQDPGVSGMSGWGGLKTMPAAYVGPNAKAAAMATPQGQSLRTGASVARAARKNPTVAKQVKSIEVAAGKGQPKAIRQNAIIKAGAVADHQRLDAIHTDAVVKRKRANLAQAVLRRMLRVGGSPTGVFSRWQPGSRGIVTIGADAGKAAKAGGKLIAGNFPPPIPGVPMDVIVALTAASNTFGVPPTVAASVVAAARSGDPKAKKELVDASKLYKAAQMGDPSAKRQMAAVVTDMKSGYAPAAEKAAVLAAAVGTTKGTKNFKMRKRAEATVAARYAAEEAPKVFPDNVWPASFLKLISYGTGPL